MRILRTREEVARPAAAKAPAPGVEATRAAERAWVRPLRFGAVLLLPILLFVLLVVGFAYEASTSRLQALLLSRLANQLTYYIGSGPSTDLVFPHGPADKRLGYAHLEEYARALQAKGFRIERQARFSPLLLSYAGMGLNPPYEEKHVAGLCVYDREKTVLFDATNRRHTFTSFREIPDPIVPALLFIENRELFADEFPLRNPAVEWDRLAHVILTYVGREAGMPASVQGGSTLATQIEKYRHSTAGMTSSPSDKVKQITSASLRAYHNGMDTRAERRRIVLNYLNSVPLAAVPGYGETNGIGEAMWGWFGKDLAQVRRDLAEPLDGPGKQRRAQTTREIVALLVANRAPSEYLGRNHAELERLVDVHLGLMSAAGVISPELCTAARAERLAFLDQAPPLAAPPFAERKASNAVRSQLLGLLGETSFYQLDRLDLTVEATFDAEAQRAVTAELARLTDPQVIAREGLRAKRLLEHGDPSRVVYSFTLYECLPLANVLRVQADNLGQPFDVNEGMKLDLGSTAKLRTLAHYLMIVADIYGRERAATRAAPAGGAFSAAVDSAVAAETNAPPTSAPGEADLAAPEEAVADEATAEIMSEDESAREALASYAGVPDLPEPGGIAGDRSAPVADDNSGRRSTAARADLIARAENARDPLTRWVLGYLGAHPEAEIEDVLAASLDRRFSANPGESFFTGGGVHTFVNFNPEDNHRIMTLREGLRNSVNLVFIRVMREIVQYHKAALGYDERTIFSNSKDPVRHQLLDEFVASEGRKLLWKYYHRYRGQSEAETYALLFGKRLSPRTVAIAHCYRHGPGLPPEALAAVLADVFGDAAPDSAAVLRLATSFGRSQLSRQDAARLARVHPIELWTVEYVLAHPAVEWAEFAAESESALTESYAWLYSPRAKRAQDLRLRILLESKAFGEIHAVWQRLGYPFGSLVPSLATAIGSSADRPTALAELVGIILRDGERVSMQRIQSLDFGTGTPYETRFVRSLPPGEQVMPPAVARALRACLIDVVENGTARRAYGAIHGPDGEIVPIGGKTGSGDNRVKSFAPGGRLIGSRVVSRTASFAFFMGDRFFGVVTAYVAGEEAAEYSFTSSLPTQIVKMLGPTLSPLATAPPAGSPRAAISAPLARQDTGMR